MFVLVPRTEEYVKLKEWEFIQGKTCDGDDSITDIGNSDLDGLKKICADMGAKVFFTMPNTVSSPLPPPPDPTLHRHIARL